jgi:N-hydroxyarylamine O-acetyltransferase
MTTSAEWIGRYLELLRVEHPEPSLARLRLLTAAHLATVPFSNVTCILRRREAGEGPVPPLDPEAILATWEQGRGGGVCFEIAEMVWRLLVGLGYQAHIALGWRGFLGSHQGVVVALDDRRYLIDVGNGSPFFEPIPLGRPFEVRRAGLAFRFHAETDAAFQERWMDGEWQTFCRYELGPPDEQLREAAYQRHHTLGESWVVDSLRLIRCLPDEVLSLRRSELVRYTCTGKETRPVSDPAAVAAEVFHLPDLPVAAALRALEAA